MSAVLSLSATDLYEDDLQYLTHSLCRRLLDEFGINAHPVTQPAAIGHKGDLSALGQIVLSGLGAGGFAVALVDVLKSYIRRKPSLQFELQKKDGVHIWWISWFWRQVGRAMASHPSISFY